MYTSNAFARGQGRDVAYGYFAQVRLKNGQRDMPKCQVFSSQHQGKGFVFLQNEDALAASVAESIQPQAVGWWLFALFAALAGLVLIGQALSRQSLVERESYPTLCDLGFRPRQLFALGMLRAGAIGVVGALGAAVFTIAVSPLTPVGEARAAEPTNGIYFDSVVLGSGVLLVVVAVLVLAPSWRASKAGAGTARTEQPFGARIRLLSSSRRPARLPASWRVSVTRWSAGKAARVCR